MSTAATSPPFDPARCVVFGAACHAGDRWCFAFLGAPDGPGVRVVDGDRGALRRVIDELRERGACLVGYDSGRHDWPLLEAVLDGRPAYRTSRALRATGATGYMPTADVSLPVDHVDLAARVRKAGRIPSMSEVAANLGRVTIRERPFPVDAIIDDRQWAEVLDCVRLELGHERAALEFHAAKLAALGWLSREAGRDLRSVPDPKVVEVVFEDAYRRVKGEAPQRLGPPPEVWYRPGPGVRRPRTQEAAAWFDAITRSPIPVAPPVPGRPPKPVFPGTSFRIGGIGLRVGKGGVHSDDTTGGPRMYYSGRKSRLVRVDVRSFYPTIIVSHGITPRAYGEVGASTFRGLLERRLDFKRRSADAGDDQERRALRVQADALKLVLNATFGKLGDPHSSLYDPEAMLKVTFTGQLLMIDLVERVTGAGARVLSVNTDGLYLGYRPGDRRWLASLREWKAEAGLSLDVDPIRRLVVLKTNHHATLERDRTIRASGAGLNAALTPTSRPNEVVVADAVTAALLRDVPPEQSIRSCIDPAGFCRVAVGRHVLVDGLGELGPELAGVVRWYWRHRSRVSLLRISGDGKMPREVGGESVEMAPSLDGVANLKGLDLSRYIAKACSVVLEVRGYRHSSRRLIHGDTLASRLLDSGLYPSPKWGGKRQVAGVDRARPSLLQVWEGRQTAGIYTGPGVGILVVDVDHVIRFRRLVDDFGSPSKAGRWREFEGALACFRDPATAEGVRAGRDRGKLIFRQEGGPDDPLARLAVDRWSAKYGVDVFYGQGIPSVLGLHPDGSEYQLEGELGPAPRFLVEALGRGAGPALDAGLRGPASWPGRVPEEARDALMGWLGELDPKLRREAIGWRSKPYRGGTIWLGRCPFPHDSGESGDGDMHIGFVGDGVPYIKCKHASCAEIRAVNARLRSGWRTERPRVAGRPESAPTPAAPAVYSPPSEGPRPEATLAGPTSIAGVMLADLEDAMVALNVAPTGSGKTYAAALVAARRYLEGRATLIAEPTIMMCRDVLEKLKEFIPEAFELDAVAEVFGRPGTMSDDEEGGEGQGRDDSFPIHGGTMVVVSSHAQLGRRGHSRFMRGLWAKLGADPETGRPAFAIIVDEAAELIRTARWEIELAHRTGRLLEPDGNGGLTFPRDKCPKFSQSTHCGECELVREGGEAWFNAAYQTRELWRPRSHRFDRDGRPLSVSHNPVRILDKLSLGPVTRVGATTWAAAALGHFLAGEFSPFDPGDRPRAKLETFRRDESTGRHIPEGQEEVFSAVFAFAHNPVVTWEHPVNELGEKVDSRTLADRKLAGDRKWDQDILFPRESCEVPRLKFTDLAVLERLARHASGERVGVVLCGATLGPDDHHVLRSVWPRLVERRHPYPDRKIRQVAVVTVEGYHGPESLSPRNGDGRLVTVTLEQVVAGLGVVFCPTRKLAEKLYRAVAGQQPTARLVVENDEKYESSKDAHREGERRTIISYSRGILGVGVNLEDIRYLVVDALAYRAVASFNPAEVSAEEFDRSRTEERLALLLQNIGRALRGEKGKTVALFVLNADADLLAAIMGSPAILEGCELPPVPATGKDLRSLVDQAGRWLVAGGGDWPDPDPSKAGKGRGRPRGGGDAAAKVAGLERMAVEAIEAGVGWREFRQKHNPHRHLDPAQLAALRGRFGVVKKTS